MKKKIMIHCFIGFDSLVDLQSENHFVENIKNHKEIYSS